jgi:hypothetical protein
VGTTGLLTRPCVALILEAERRTSSRPLEEYVELDELRQNHPLKDVL